MKKNKVGIKKQIKKKIELSMSNKFERNRLRQPNYEHKSVDVQLLSKSDRNKLRSCDISSLIKETNYQKKVFVDYDVMICIPSHNRYIKVRRLISQFYEQQSQYTFKIILLNDGSSDKRYDKLVEEFPEIILLKNEIANGKVLHWYCYNQMWEQLKNIQHHVVLQMDDDFILCSDFLNKIISLYFELKKNNNKIKAIAPHLWSFNKFSENESWWRRTDFVDGIALLDDEVIKYLNYELKPVDAELVSKAGVPVRAWSQIGEGIKSMNGIIYRTNYSMVYHDGNGDSKLHGDVRKKNKGGVYTQKYVE
jgi:hypothetical protein